MILYLNIFVKSIKLTRLWSSFIDTYIHTSSFYFLELNISKDAGKVQYNADARNARTLIHMNTWTLPLWSPSETGPANPQDEIDEVTTHSVINENTVYH
jgi:hypothetical protein